MKQNKNSNSKNPTIMKTKNIAIICAIIMSLVTTSCMSTQGTTMIQPTDLGVNHIDNPSVTTHTYSHDVKPVIEM